MINSHWTDFCHHIKQDSAKAKKKDIKYNEQDVTDMIFIGPDTDVISMRKGERYYIIFIVLCIYGTCLFIF